MIQLIPYSKIDGQWSLPDEALEDAFYKTGETIRSIFWTGKINTPKDFINYFKMPSNLPVFVFKDSKPCGYAWINNIGMGHACSHFNVFKEFWGSEDKKEIFESVMSYWFGFKDSHGFIFDTLLGMIPKFNTHAMRYVEENGFVRAGEIPNMVVDPYSNQKFPIVIFYRSR